MAVICTIIFDMDGVIIDSEPVHRKVEKEIFTELGLSITDEQLKNYTGTSSHEMWTEIINSNQLELSPAEITRINHERYIRHLKTLTKLPAVNGVKELITSLFHSGKKLVLASSSSREQIEFILRELKIRNCFLHIVSGAELPKSKPHPMIFLKAAALVNAEPKECLVIEDSNHGVTAAKAAGMRCIGFINPNSGNQDLTQADITITDFSKLNIDEVMYTYSG
jgi:HAD superfamily hydrolase (TIGR01509 family)